MEDEDPFMLHWLCHGCWWPGDTRSQVISNHGIDLVLPEYAPLSQIPQRTSPISHNAPFRTEMCTFLFWMVHCGIWERCIVGFVQRVYCGYTSSRVNSLCPCPGLNGWNFADLERNLCILTEVSLKFVPKKPVWKLAMYWNASFVNKRPFLLSSKKYLNLPSQES